MVHHSPIVLACIDTPLKAILQAHKSSRDNLVINRKPNAVVGKCPNNNYPARQNFCNSWMHKQPRGNSTFFLLIFNLLITQRNHTS